MVSKGNRGFTLIELLVVIAIIGILAALLLPALNAVRRNAKKTDCLNNLNGIGKAIMIYEDRNKAYPDGTSTTFLDNLRAGAGGAVQDAQFVCKLTGNTAGPGITDYRGPAQRVTDQFPASTAIVGDRTSCHGSVEGRGPEVAVGSSTLRNDRHHRAGGSQWDRPLHFNRATAQFP
jgi:prepilin-type N-terminal cleavage/methylation domain-containing protein